MLAADSCNLRRFAILLFTLLCSSCLGSDKLAGDSDDASSGGRQADRPAYENRDADATVEATGSTDNATGESAPNGESTGGGQAASTDAGAQSSGGGTGSSTSGGTQGLDPTSILFTEDFEGAQDDAIPSGFKSFVSYIVDMNNTKSSGTYALVDGSKPHAGSKALHVKSGGPPAMITKALPAGTKALFVRTWVFLTGSLGKAPGRNHETLLGVRKSVGGAHDEVRFGEIKGVIGVNEVPSDNISPKMDQWGKGPEITAGAWHCIEVAFRADLPAHEVRAWNDGSEVFAVNDSSQWQNGALSPTFLEGKFVELILGWHSFSNYANEIWFDDLVVASKRIGCD